ncbi:MAG TPA: tail fiber domain-containing protein [Pyrinomonadaceae bacterium]|nr:tail fiber domain-containing protein [Pyrinomonadaceae bacterium]
MKNQKSFVLVIFVCAALACLQTAALGQGASQSADAKAANVRAEGMGVRFDSTISYSNATLTISAPDGSVYKREFKGGSAVSFALNDKTGAALGNGQYNYEIRFTTVQQDSRLMSAPRGAGSVEDENGRINGRASSVQSVVQSGSFALQNGALYVGNDIEPTSRRTSSTKSLETGPQQPRSPGVLSGNTATRLRNHRFSLLSMPDQVIPDDLIVQGSACVGLDCVNNESFGFDTIRLKENNTRIKFDDTSTSAGFPNHDWQLTANDSASGGANKFSIEEITAGTVPFTITGNAPSNAIFVDSTGRVGLRTSTPVLDLHTSTSNTPAHRYEQTNAGGFTAQTWDVAGNEANFFVRDVTGGSRLPFRIRPGAPTSSIDISATGAVGVGTASPAVQLHLVNSSTAQARVESTGNAAAVADFKNLSRRWVIGTGILSAAGDFSIFDANASATRVFLDTSGNVGIGTSAPLQLLSVNGTAGKPGGGTWDVFSDERLKNIKGRYNTGLKALMQLQPIRYEYKRDNPLGIKSEGENVGFGAQTLQKIIPEAVTMNSAGYLMVKSDPILWTMLNAIKEQQKEIAELKGQVRRLQTASHRRRK